MLFEKKFHILNTLFCLQYFCPYQYRLRPCELCSGSKEHRGQSARWEGSRRAASRHQGRCLRRQLCSRSGYYTHGTGEGKIEDKMRRNKSTHQDGDSRIRAFNIGKLPMLFCLLEKISRCSSLLVVLGWPVWIQNNNFYLRTFFFQAKFNIVNEDSNSKTCIIECDGIGLTYVWNPR